VGFTTIRGFPGDETPEKDGDAPAAMPLGYYRKKKNLFSCKGAKVLKKAIFRGNCTRYIQNTVISTKISTVS